MFNSAEATFSNLRDNYLLDVNYNGTVRWIFPDILRSYCHVDIKYFPFDKYIMILFYVTKYAIIIEPSTNKGKIVFWNFSHGPYNKYCL